MKAQYTLLSTEEANLMRAQPQQKRLKIAMTHKEVIAELRGIHADYGHGPDSSAVLIVGCGGYGKTLAMVQHIIAIMGDKNTPVIFSPENSEGEIYERLCDYYGISSIPKISENDLRDLSEVAEQLKTVEPVEINPFTSDQMFNKDLRPFYIKASDRGGIKRKKRRF